MTKLRADLAFRWIPVSEQLPAHGLPVFVRRANGTADRAEIHELYFDGMPAWFLPEGPTPVEMGQHWAHIPPLEEA